MKDSYGSTLREAMKHSMKEAAGYKRLNIRERPRWPLIHKIVGTAVIVFVAITIAVQIALWIKR